MCYRKHLLLIFSLIATIHGRKLTKNFPLLNIREIGDLKLIIDQKVIELPLTTNIDENVEELMQDVIKYNCSSEICIAEKRILIDDILKKNSTLKSIKEAKQDASLSRKKREWGPWSNFLKWSGGVMNEQDRKPLNDFLMKLYTDQKSMTERIEKLEVKIDESAQLKADVDNLQKDLQELKESLYIQNVKEKFSSISTFIDALLSSHINGFIDSMLIDDQLLNNLDAVKDSLRNDRQLICEKSLDCIRGAKVKITYKNGSYFTSLELPVATTRTMKLLSLKSVPISYDNFVIIMKPKHKYLILDNEDLMTVNDNILTNCIGSDSDLLFCRVQDVISNVNKLDCLFAAVRDKIVDFEVCSQCMELLELESHAAIKLDKGSYWIYSQSSTKVTTNCHESDIESRNVSGTEILELKYGCHVTFKNMLLTSYSTVDEKFHDSFYANISLERVKEIIDIMEPTAVLSENIPYDLFTAIPSGLKEKQKYTKDESWQAKNQWQESEIKILHAEHNKAIIIALVITIAALLFIVVRKHKSIFILTSTDKDIRQQEAHLDSDERLKDQDSVSDLSVYWKTEKK